MAEFTLKNDKLQLTVAEHGAEIRSLIRNADGREMMWQADPALWGRTSPVLFPLVGQYRDKISYYEGKAYQMSQHGFARDMDFALVRSTDGWNEDHHLQREEQDGEATIPSQNMESQKELWFSLTDSETTHEKYPFAFRLTIGYRLDGDTVTVCWKVKNTDTKKMYFSIGGHPAFGCDLNHSYLAFEKDGKTVERALTCNVIEGDGSGCLSDRQKKLELSGGCLALSDELFAEDALIIEDRQADAVTLLDAEQKRLLTVSFDAPLFGIWSPVGKHAPFVCIEPWYGRCDRVDFGQKLEEREYGNARESGEEFLVSYRIKIFEELSEL